MSERDRGSSLAAVVFRLLLRFYPLRFRETYGSDMELLFRRRMLRASAKGSRVFIRAAFAAFGDALRGAVTERLTSRRPASGGYRFSALSDVRIIVRRLVTHDRQFAVFACGTMALGLQSSILVFSLVTGLLFRPLPYDDPSHLVGIAVSHPAKSILNRSLSPDSSEAVRALPGIEAAAEYTSRGLNLTLDTGPQRVAGASTTAELFSVLRVAPLVGRVFSDDEIRRAEPVVVVSELLVQRARWTVPEALGRTLTVDGQDRTVVGVMPASFRFPDTTQVWIPLAPSLPGEAIDGDLAVVARVRTGQIAALQAQLQSAAYMLARTHEAGWTLHTRSLNPLRAEGLAPLLFTAVAGAMLLLIVVTANVAALMLARGIARQAEFGVMVALGATRRRIVLHLLLESAVIVAVAAGVAFTLAGWILAYVPAVLPVTELPEWMRFEMDGRVLLFTVIAAVLGTLGMGLMPSLQSTNGDLASCIRTAARTIVGGRATSLQRGLVGVQLLVATVLLTGGGLMLRSYLALAGTNPGYNATGVYMLETELPEARYRTSADAVRFYAALVDALNGAGEVGSAAVAGGTPAGRTGTQGTGSFEDVALPGDAAPTGSARVEQVVVSSGFFETLGVPLKLGRPFRQNEPDDTAIVTEEFARQYWPSASPLEQSIGVRGADGLTLVRVIGVAGDMQDAFAGEGADASVRPRVYLPLHFGISPGATVYARGVESADGHGVASAMRTAVNALDRDQAVWATTSLVDYLAVTRSPVKWFGYLLGACSVMASVVACVGLYGVVSHAVRRRQREFAIRAAFGASPVQVVGIVLRDALWPSAVGLTLGIAGGAVLGRALSTLLYGVPTFDPVVTGVTAVVLVSAIVLASVVPAVRLSRLDPSLLLRAD